MKAARMEADLHRRVGELLAELKAITPQLSEPLPQEVISGFAAETATMQEAHSLAKKPPEIINLIAEHLAADEDVLGPRGWAIPKEAERD